MKVIILNEGSSRNIGDQAINFGLISILKKIVHNDNLNICNYSLQKCERFKQGDLIKSKKSDSNIPKFSILHYVLWTINYIRKILIAFKNIKDSDLIIIGGGGILINNRKQFITAIFIWTNLARLLNIDIVMLGVSSNSDLSNYEIKLLKNSCKYFRKIYVRDSNTIKYLEDQGIIVNGLSSDFALNIPKVNTEERKKIACINITSSHVNFDKYTFVIKLLATNLKNHEIYLITTGDPGDEMLLHQFIDIENVKKIIKCTNYEEYLYITSRSSFVIGSRLHGAILSLSQKTPTFILDISSKHIGFYETHNLKKYIIKIDEIQSEKNINSDRLYKLIDEFVFDIDFFQKTNIEILDNIINEKQ